MNPASQAEKEKEEKVCLSQMLCDVALLTCCCWLQRAKRIQELEEQVRVLLMQQGGVKDEMTPDSMAVVTGTVLTRSGTEDHKLQIQRLKEVFQKRFRQFRDGVYLLTGYKVSDDVVCVWIGCCDCDCVCTCVLRRWRCQIPTDTLCSHYGPCTWSEKRCERCVFCFALTLFDFDNNCIACTHVRTH